MSKRWMILVPAVAAMAMTMPIVVYAAPWDGEWEGTVKHSDLPCSPCVVRLTVNDGLPNVRSSTSIPSFTISPEGEVTLEVPMQAAGNAVRSNCRLTGKVQTTTIAAAGSCGNYSSQAELQLRRISAAATSRDRPCRLQPFSRAIGSPTSSIRRSRRN